MTLGDDVMPPPLARGAVHGDCDRDGDLDVLVNQNDGTARLCRNHGGKQWRAVRCGSSYGSQSDLALTFGLGPTRPSRRSRSSGRAARRTA